MRIAGTQSSRRSRASAESNATSVPVSAHLVRQFHEAFDVPILENPSIPAINRVELRRRLITEEFREVMAELDRIVARHHRYSQASQVLNDVARLAKELSDLRYVIWGTDLEFGIPSHEVDVAVHMSNMSKLGADGQPVRRHDGKVIKGPNYYEPDIIAALGIIEGSTAS